METIELERDLTVMYVDAASFPEGVLNAHERIHALVPPSRERSYFGISRPEGPGIVYRAAAEQLDPGEKERFGLPSLVLRKGSYISRFVPDFMKDVSIIGRTFQELLQHPNLDTQGYCVEWYGEDGKNVTLMVRLQDQ
ncbi:MAG: transcriptional regulator [Chitinophagaceae bacterium]|nr:MAG: transcriptional regulator [Chitinophagaceae bacterium]